MNQSIKKFAGVFLAVAITASALAGCGAQKGSSSTTSAGTSSAKTESSAISSQTLDYGQGLTEQGFFADVKALDFVKLPEYKGMKIPADVSAVKDEDIQSQIDSIMSSFTTSDKVMDAEVKDGDSVNIDYVGSVGGVEFEGGSTGGAGTVVVIGETQYIDDFIQQIVGHKPGDSFDINVTFPEDYGKDNLNGKDAVFKTTVNYIEGEKKTPELNDAFVAENLKAQYKWETVAQMKEEMKSKLQETAEKEYLWKQVSEQATVSEVPQSVIEYYKNDMKNYYTSTAQQSGMDVDTFLKTYASGATMEDLVAKAEPDLKKQGEQSMILQAIAEDSKIEVKDEDIAAYFKESMGTEDYKQYSDQYGMPYLRMVVREVKVQEMLSKSAVRA